MLTARFSTARTSLHKITLESAVQCRNKNKVNDHALGSNTRTQGRKSQPKNKTHLTLGVLQQCKIHIPVKWIAFWCVRDRNRDSIFKGLHKLNLNRQ